MKPRMNALKLTLFLAICLTGAATAQQLLNGIDLPPHWHEQYEVVSENDGILTYRDRISGVTLTYVFNKPLSLNPVTLLADTVVHINPDQIDTTQFEGRFEYMGSAPVYNASMKIIVFDSNNNGKGEILGIRKELGVLYPHNEFYEWDSATRSFLQVVNFQVPELEKGGIILMGGDIDRDGYPEVYTTVSDCLRVYESTSSKPYAEIHRYTHYSTAGLLPMGCKIDDFDNDNKLEIITMTQDFDSTVNGTNYMGIIWENLGSDSNFIETKKFVFPFNHGTGDYATGDIDLDDKMEIFKADGYGRVYGYENVADDSFRLHFQEQLPVGNAYFHFSNGDMDGDGLPEVVLGGSTWDNNIITILESAGNDSFAVPLAYEIHWNGGVYGRRVVAGDVEGDGVSEFLVDVGGWILLFKAVADNRYDIIWAKRVHFPWGCGMGDVDGDGSDEIILGQAIWEDGQHYSNSLVFKYNLPTAITAPVNHNTLSKIPVTIYPNPFNNQVEVRYRLLKPNYVKLTVYNILGQKVAVLNDQQQPAGEYRVSWNGEEVSSGIYIITAEIGKETYYLKALLLR